MAPKALPVGYQFRPTDEELIHSFLEIKSAGKTLLDCCPILDRALFGEKPPWEVLMEDDPWEYCSEGNSRKKTIYVFSKLIGLGKNRAVRTTGCGTWHGKAAKNKIKNSQGKYIGQKRYFTFKTKNGLETSKGKWMMHEYSLNDNANLVLCRVTVDEKFHTAATTTVGYNMSTTWEAGGTSTDQLDGKRKSSTVLDDDGIRKVCRGSGSGREIVITELDEIGEINDISYPLVDFDDDQTVQNLSITDEWKFASFSEAMQEMQINANYNEFENIPFVTTTCSKEMPMYPAGARYDNRAFQVPLITDELGEVLRDSEGMHKQEIADYCIGSENIPFATSNDCVVAAELLDSCPTMQQTESQQGKEMPAGGTRGYETRNNLKSGGWRPITAFLDEAESLLLQSTDKLDDGRLANMVDNMLSCKSQSITCNRN